MKLGLCHQTPVGVPTQIPLGASADPPLALHFQTLLKGEGDVKVHGKVEMAVWERSPQRGLGWSPTGGREAETPEGCGAEH